MKKQSNAVKHELPLLPLGAMMCGMAVVTPVMPVQAAEADQQLKTVVVKDATEKDPLNLNENNGYQATTTRIGKTLQDPHDIPQGITVVTRELMDDQQVSSLKEALRNVSGLTFNATEGGRAGDNFNLRGFYTFGDTYLDGVRDTAQYDREVFNLEQVEVLRGSGSMLFGRGQAGGVINQVSKTPKLKDANRVTASVGSHNYNQVTGDFNKKVGETTAIRLNVMNRGQGSWRSNGDTGAEPEVNRYGVAPSIAFGLGTNNQFTLSHYHAKSDDNQDLGIPFLNKRPDESKIRNFYGTHLNFDRSETNITTLSHLYRFSNNTEVRTVARAANYKRDMLAAAPSNHGSPNLSASGFSSKSYKNRIFDTDNLVLQSDISHKTTLGGMKHELLAGIEYLNEESSTGTRPALASRPTVPIGGSSFAVYAPGDYTLNKAYSGHTYSVFMQDQVEFIKNWKFLAGIRHDDLSTKYYNTTNGDKLTLSEQSYRSALSWQPEDWQHYYLSWSDSFSPTADLYQYSSQFPAERSEVWELGGKWLMMEGDLTLRAALYRADKQYERSVDVEVARANPIVTNKRRTDGIEFEVAGRITPKWEVFAGVALMDPKIKEVAVNPSGAADARLKDQTARNAATYTYNLWSTYKFMPKWKAGVGFDAKSDRYGYNPAASVSNAFTNGKFDPNTAPAYVRWDGMLAYEEKNYAIRLNVYNLTDTEWYDSIYEQGGFVVPGMKQTAILTTELKF